MIEPLPSPFASLYQAHHASYREDLPFWLDLAALAGGPVLELGCGTGRVSIPLATAGFEVYGLDRDLGMLAVLDTQLPPEARRRAHVFQGDMAAFHLEKRFALVISPCNTLSTLPGEALRATLALAHCHLLPGGLFAASLPNPHVLRRLSAHSEPEPEEVFRHPESGHPVQVSTGWRRQGEAVEMAWHYDHLLPDGRVERLTWRVSHSLAPVGVYVEELARARLEVIQTLGDFAGAPFSEDAPNLILIAAR